MLSNHEPKWCFPHFH